jgi:hypothetical protein
MAIYQSMQRVRFSSPDGYAKFKLLFGEVGTQLKTLPGFLHLTWWVHPTGPELVQRGQPVDQPGSPQGLAHERLTTSRPRSGRFEAAPSWRTSSPTSS